MQTEIQRNIWKIFNNLPADQYSFEILIKQNQTLAFNTQLEQHLIDGAKNLIIRQYDISRNYHLSDKSLEEFQQQIEHSDECSLVNEEDQFLFAKDIQYGHIILDNLIFSMAGSIFQTGNPLNFYLTNSLINVEYLNFAIEILHDCSTLKSYATYGDIFIRNVTIFGDRKIEQKKVMMLFHQNHNFTFDNITISSFTYLTDANYLQFSLTSIDTCIVPINDGRTKIQRFTNVIIKDIPSRVNVANVFYIQFHKGSDRLRNFQYLVENITMIDVYTSQTVLFIGTSLTELTLNNVYIQNLTHKQVHGGIVNITQFLVNEKIDAQIVTKFSGTPNNAIAEFNNLLFENNKVYANKLYSSSYYMYQFKMQSLQIYDSSFINFTYIDSFKQGSFIVKIVAMDLYASLIWNTVFKNVIIDNNELNFLLFQGYNQINKLVPTDRYYVEINNVMLRKSRVKKENSLIKIDSYSNKLNTTILIANSSFENNYFFGGGYLIDLFQNEINPMLIVNTTFINNTRGISNSNITGNEAYDSSISYISDSLDNFSNFSSDFFTNNILVNGIVKRLVSAANLSYIKHQFMDQQLRIQEHQQRAIFNILRSQQISIVTSNVTNFNKELIYIQYSLLEFISSSVDSEQISENAQDQTIVTEQCSYEIFNNTFTRNIATIQGGAINYNKNQPIHILSNEFINNSAPYGEDIGSIPFNIKLVGEIPDRNIKSGVKYKELIKFEVLDFQNNRITNDYSTNLKIVQMNSTFSSVVGKTQSKAEAGLVKFDDLIILAKPGLANAQIVLNLQNVQEEAKLAQIKDTGGYGGNLCQVCVNVNGTQYSRTQPYNCVACPDQGINFLVLEAILPISIYLVILVVVNIKYDINSDIPVLSRVLTNFFQILSCTNVMNLGWPGPLQRFLESFSHIGDSVQNAMYIDCLISSSNSNKESHLSIYIKTMIIGFLPILIISLFAFGFLFMIVSKQTQLQRARFWFVLMIIIVMHFTYPTIVRSIFNLFFCIELDKGEYWLQSDMEVNCFDGQHIKLGLLIGLPIVLIWLIILPLKTLWLIFNQREVYKTHSFNEKFKFICSGLKKDQFYWEFVNLFRKFFLVLISITLQTSLSLFKLMVSFIVLSTIYRIQMRLKPYQNPLINELEQREMLTTLVTFFGSLFFINSEFADWNRYATLSIIIAFNVWFFTLFIYAFSSQFKLEMMLTVAKIFRHLALVNEDTNKFKKAKINVEQNNNIKQHSDSLDSNDEDRQLTIQNAKSLINLKTKNRSKLKSRRNHHKSAFTDRELLDNYSLFELSQRDGISQNQSNQKSTHIHELLSVPISDTINNQTQINLINYVTNIQDNKTLATQMNSYYKAPIDQNNANEPQRSNLKVKQYKQERKTLKDDLKFKLERIQKSNKLPLDY
ncbi:UNKNOWN [Stylonychia lemnae]|uniref:Transmembrane protein n=1 Tax=Stylonychia lemnae TaxID=5949 RepID=A0A078A5V0_STYLE|nr:UNKNOWN [Stylonychia lemnae]|eukprot:CDW77569.1 UNKNOWN [Stylonychia lemnae]